MLETDERLFWKYENNNIESMMTIASRRGLSLSVSVRVCVCVHVKERLKDRKKNDRLLLVCQSYKVTSPT